MADPVNEMRTVLSNVGEENEMRDDLKDKAMHAGNGEFENESGVSSLSKYDDAANCDSKMKNNLKVSVNESNVSGSQQNEGFNMIVENQAPDNTINGIEIQEENNNPRNDGADTRVEPEIDRMITEIETTLKSRDEAQDNRSKRKGKKPGNENFVGSRNRKKFCETAGRGEQGAKRIGEENSSATEVKRYHLRNKMAVKRSKYQATIKGYQAYVSGLENTKVKSEDLSFQETVGESPQDVMIITEDFSVDDTGNVRIENNESSSDDDIDEWICQSDEEDNDDDDDDDDDDGGDSFQDTMVRTLFDNFCLNSWLILEHTKNEHFRCKSNDVFREHFSYIVVQNFFFKFL